VPGGAIARHQVTCNVDLHRGLPQAPPRAGLLACLLADQPAPQPDGDGMGARARLELGEQVADVRLDGLLGEKQPLADLPVDEAVGDELEDLDLARGRLLLGGSSGRLQRDHLRAALAVAVAPARGNLLEAARVVQIAVHDLLALSRVHDGGIGLPPPLL